MAFEQFDTVRIFRPSLQIEHAIRDRARANLRSTFSPGEYRGAEAANRILQHQFKIYEALLQPLIPKLSCRGGAEFLLFQYDQAWQLLHGAEILDLNERNRWAWIEPRMKRAIKFLVESICMFGSTEAHAPRSRREAEFAAEAALACAENMVDLGTQSDLVHSVFPQECVLRVFNSGPYDFTLDIEGSRAGYNDAFSERIIRDRRSRDRFVPWPQFDNHTATHQRFLDDPFRKEFGMSYGEFIAALLAVINDAQPSLHPDAFPTLFVNRKRVIDELANSGRQRNAIERALKGFSITREGLLKEKRVVWKPKQESRAYRRGFFVLPHEDGPHFAFSREMARESLMHLVSWVSYRHLPKEWKTHITTKAAHMLSREAGIWFERVVRQRFNDLGFAGNRAQKTIGEGTYRVTIPEDVGEIDFIGYHPEQRLLVVAEAKMVMTGLEAAYWRDDLDEFVFRHGSYADRFRRKLAWVLNQRKAICASLNVERDASVGAIMLTLYPCIAREFIADFPCVSITEFMLDYEACSNWPYDKM
jgi:hypothetical protein